MPPTPPRPDNSSEGALPPAEWARLIPARYQNPPSPQLPPDIQAILMGIAQAQQQQGGPSLDQLRFYGGAGNYAAWQGRGGYPPQVAGPPPWIRHAPPPQSMPQPYNGPPAIGFAGTRS